MATPGRTEGASLSAQTLANDEVAALLEQRAVSVRLLSGRAPAGAVFARRQTGRPLRQAIHGGRSFRRASLAASSRPARSSRSSERPGQPPFVEVNFMGLTGPLGVLPHRLHRTVADRIRQKDTALRDFLDLFHHRIISLFYQAWEKYRFTIAYERGERDRFSHHLLDLIGLGTPRPAESPGGRRRLAALLLRPALHEHALGGGARTDSDRLLRSAGGGRAVRRRLVSHGCRESVPPRRRDRVERTVGLGRRRRATRSGTSSRESESGWVR